MKFWRWPAVLLVVLAAAHLEDAHLVVPAWATTVALTLAPATKGVPTFRSAPSADSEHLIDHDFLANVRSNLFYLDLFAGSNLVLLATGFYDRVHMCPFE